MEMFKPEIEHAPKAEKLKKYTYRDNHNNREVVFECVASDVLEADKLYKEATGHDVEKQGHIALDFETIEEDE